LRLFAGFRFTERLQFFPDPLEWERGDRYAACVAMLTDQLEPKVIDGAFAGRGDRLALARTPGDCHLWSVREPTVDCADPHDYEYVGEVASPDGPWPGSPGPTVSPACEAMLTDTASTTRRDSVTLEVFAVATGTAAREAGDRRVACFAIGVQDGFPVRIAGSVAGLWEPAGVPEDGFTT
jgi:Septum formation